MKKISVLIMLALCITIGGVYATWTFADNPVSVVTNAETGVYVNDPVTATNRGTVVIDNQLPTLSINDNAPVDYHPEWDSAIADGTNNMLTVTFTSSAGVTPDAEGNIYILIAFTLKGDNTYEGQNIFTYTKVDGLGSYIKGTDVAETDPVFYACIVKCNVEDSSNSYTFTKQIKPTDVMNKLLVNNDIEVPTKGDYDIYKTAVTSNKIFVTVTELPAEVAATYTANTVAADTTVKN